MMSTMGGGNGGLSLQESLSRINELGGETMEGLMGSEFPSLDWGEGWHGTGHGTGNGSGSTLLNDQDSLWKSMINTGDVQSDREIQHQQPSPHATSIKHSSTTTPQPNAGMSFALARAAEVANAPLPQGIGEASREGMIGRPLEAINEAKNLITDLVSVRNPFDGWRNRFDATSTDLSVLLTDRQSRTPTAFNAILRGVPRSLLDDVLHSLFTHSGCHPSSDFLDQTL